MTRGIRSVTRHILFVVLLTLCSSSVFAASLGDGMSLTVENRLRFEYFKDYDFNQIQLDKDDFQYWFNSTRLRFNSKQWVAYAQYDLRGFSDPLEVKFLDTELGIPNRTVSQQDFFNIEKLYVARRGDKMELRLGDFYITLNRGLMLSFRKEDDYNFDRSLRGILFKGGYGAFGATAFGGTTNILNIDPSTYRYRSDPNDLVAGAEVRVEPFKGLALAVNGTGIQYGLMLDRDEAGFLKNDQTMMFGGSAAAAGLIPHLDIYLTASGIWRNEFVEDIEKDNLARKPMDQDGWGFYGSIIFTWQPITVLVEGKNYENFRVVRERSPLALNYYDHEAGYPKPRQQPEDQSYAEDIWYNYAPTLLPVDVELQNNQDARGARVKISGRIKPAGLLLFADGVWQQTAGISGEPGGEFSHTERHLYAGLEWSFRGHRAQLEGGYWDDKYENENTGEELTQIKVYRLRVLGKFHLPYRMGIEADMKWRRKHEGEDAFVDEIDSALTLHLPMNFKVSYLYSAELYGGNEGSGVEEEQKHYNAGVISYSYRNWVKVALLGGKLRGGYKCFGGACRKFPDFTGFRLDLTLKY